LLRAPEDSHFSSVWETLQHIRPGFISDCITFEQEKKARNDDDDDDDDDLCDI
jgi:hypothetical protein